jgi:hypothetical protein
MEQEEFPEMQELIVGTRTMPREDWVRTRAFAYMTSLLHFDKLLQIPFVICRELGTTAHDGSEARPRYRELIELFLAPDLDTARFPRVAQARDFFLNHARAIQNGKDEYCHSEAWLGVHWPPDEFMFITIIRDGHIGEFYDEALELLTRFVRIDPQLVSQALALNFALLELPFRSGTQTVTCDWNILDIYRDAIASKPVNVVRGRCEYAINWSASQWTSWNTWLERVVWWRNRAGQYFLKEGLQASRTVPTRANEPLPAGHYY